MHRLLLIIIMLLSFARVAAATPAVTWSTDLSAALLQAKAEHRLVLVHFSGSDWNPWCRQLETEIFSRKHFVAYAQARLVLVTIDFPRLKPLPQEIAAQNAALVTKYSITLYPTLLLLNPAGTELGRIAYIQGGPKTFVRELERFAALPVAKP